MICLERSLIGVNVFPSSGNTSSICSFFFDEFIIWFTKREISVCRFWSCSSACSGIPSNRWSITGSNLSEFFLVAQDLSWLLHKRGFLVELCEDFLFVEILLIFSRRISASVLSRFLWTSFTRQTVRIESRNMIALLTVSQNSYPSICTRGESYLYTFIVHSTPFQIVWNLSRFVQFISRSDHRCG